MRNSFAPNVRKAFEQHDIEDEKLELVIADLFDSFQKHLLSHSSNFINELTKVQNVDQYSRNKQRRR